MTKRWFVLCAVVAMFGAACDADDGAWSNPEPTDEPLPQAKISGKEILGQQPRTISTDFEPVPFTGKIVDCQLPERPKDPALLAPGSVVPAWSLDDRVCLGRDAGVGETYCNWLTEYEARYRAVADCHYRALKTLDKIGEEYTQRSAEPWAEIKKRTLDGVWAMSPEEAVADVGLHGSWVAALMAPEQEIVPATPFCFERGRQQTVAEAGDAVRFALWTLWQLAEAKQAWALDGLVKGLQTRPNPNLPAIRIAVRPEEVPPRHATGSCAFYSTAQRSTTAQ